MTNNGSLEIVRKLGVGGMATVYLANLRDASRGTTRTVAVKKAHAFLADDPMTVSTFEDEAALGASIRHPNVVGVIDLVDASEGEAASLVMEFIDGVDLGKLVRAAALTGRRLPVDVVAAIARDVLAGLHAAHESSLAIVHRDVSPQNILVGFDGVVRVTDFGVAKAALRQQHTEQGAIKGTLRYLAPEQLNGACDRRADVYSLGVVLWELLTGSRMRTGEGVEMLVEILCAQVQAPSASAPEAAALDTIVMRALDRSVDDRFATALEMLSAIESAVAVASSARVAAVVAQVMNAAEPKVEAPAAAPHVVVASIVEAPVAQLVAVDVVTVVAESVEAVLAELFVVQDAFRRADSLSAASAYERADGHLRQSRRASREQPQSHLPRFADSRGARSVRGFRGWSSDDRADGGGVRTEGRELRDSLREPESSRSSA